MKRKVFLTAGILALMSGAALNAQVGINTETPKASLDIVASKTDGTTAEGIIAPRLTLAELKGKDAQYTNEHRGAFVYVTDVSGGTTPKTANVIAEGYYYFDGGVWIAFKAAAPPAGITISSITYNSATGDMTFTFSDASTQIVNIPPATMTEVDGIVGNEVTDVTNATLVRAGSGTTAAPYTLARAAITGDVSVPAASNSATLAAVTRSNTTSAAAPAHGATFTAIDGVTTDTKGRVTAVNTKTVTLPTDNTTASNGLTETGNDVQLGGTLTKATTINQSTYNLTHSGTGKLIVNTPLQITSGAPATGKVLTSDASGNATWQVIQLHFLPGVRGAGVNIPFQDGSVTQYTGSYIDLPQGKWQVNVEMLMRNVGAALTANDWLWLRTTFCDSGTRFAISSDIEGTQLMSSEIQGPSLSATNGYLKYAMLKGFVVINNTSGATKRYYYWTYSATANNNVAGAYLSVFGGPAGENRILATPISL